MWLFSVLLQARQRPPAVFAARAALRLRRGTLPAESNTLSNARRTRPLVMPRAMPLVLAWRDCLSMVSAVSHTLQLRISLRFWLRRSSPTLLSHPKARKKAGRTSKTFAIQLMLPVQFPGRRLRRQGELSGGLLLGPCQVHLKRKASSAARPTDVRRPPRGRSPPRWPPSPAARSGVLPVDSRGQTEGPWRGHIPKLSDSGRRRSQSQDGRPSSPRRAARQIHRPRGRSPSRPRALALFRTPPPGGALTTAPPVCPRPAQPRPPRRRRAGGRRGGGRHGVTGRPCGRCGRSRIGPTMPGGAWGQRCPWHLRRPRATLRPQRGLASALVQTRRWHRASPRRRSLGHGKRPPTRLR
mmetsp:Transcript_22855/g.51686  ORF Transcript_22855/g.51686 Transcript_22855/m.51686 type:complete len:354 (+) Transcript_22855:467-1528(+)